jgi:hypothetical protein
MRNTNLLLWAALILVSAAPRARALDEAALLANLKTFAGQLDGLAEEKSRMGIDQVVVAQVTGSRNDRYDPLALRVVINKATLEAAAAEVAACSNAQGNPPEWILAVHLLPVYMHELRHSYNNSVLGEGSVSKEDEVSAYITSMAAYAQSRQRWPAAYNCGSPYSAAHYRLNALAWTPKGVAGIEGVINGQGIGVSDAYKSNCSVRTDQDSCALLAREKFARIQDLRKALSEPGADPAQVCSRLASRLADDSCSDKDSAMRLIWEVSVQKMFWNSNARVQAARDYYRNTEWPRGEALWRAAVKP